MFAHEDDSGVSEVDLEQYQRGYQNAIDDFQKKLKLRSRDVIINKRRSNAKRPSSSQTNTENKKRNKKMMYKKL